MKFNFQNILLSLSVLLLGQQAFSQDKRFIGTWQGTLDLGVQLRIVFHVSYDGNTYQSTIDSPDQSVFGVKCEETTISGTQMTIEMKSLVASFNGTLYDDSTIKGNFKQQVEIPLELRKTDKLKELNKDISRPQTPKPPFPYKSENVYYNNTDQSIRYGATITIPEGKGPFPAMILITGSGAQDRDETIFNHKLFAVVADQLTRNGYVILRVDDRGIKETTGNFATATSADFADDVNNGLNYLLTRPEVDKKKLGMLGHSEGGMIAPMVATQRNDINFIILLAGPGVNIIDLMAAQSAAVAKSAGLSDAAVNQIAWLYKKSVPAILNTSDTAIAHANVKKINEAWASGQPDSILSELDFSTPEDRDRHVVEMIQGFNSPWFKYFIAFDPAKYLEKLKCKVLALNGNKDIQVISSQNLPGIEASLKKAGNKQFEIVEMPGLNHLFQECSSCTVEEYAKLEQTVSPKLLEVITQWLNKNVK